jgi:uncharacterized protein
VEGDDDVYELLARATGFDWDDGNAPKVASRHAVDPGECEQAFFVEPFAAAFDTKHAAHEPRWRALGRTLAGRRLYLVFTFRGTGGTLIRVIQARDMNRKERDQYEQIQTRAEKDSNVQDGS